MTVIASRPPVGALLREWRQHRRLSQFELSLQAGVSSRHLSFVETGRSRPSADDAASPRRATRGAACLSATTLLLAAGSAPAFAAARVRRAELGSVGDAIDAGVLRRTRALSSTIVIDRHWSIVAANRAVDVLFARHVAAELLEPPINVLRLSLHPGGLAPRIRNLHVWRTHLLERSHREAPASGDPALTVLHDELASYPDREAGPGLDPAFADIAVPLRLRHGESELAFISTKTTFGTAVDVTVAELSIESFFPADPQTTGTMRSLVDESGHAAVF